MSRALFETRGPRLKKLQRGPDNDVVRGLFSPRALLVRVVGLGAEEGVPRTEGLAEWSEADGSERSDAIRDFLGAAEEFDLKRDFADVTGTPVPQEAKVFCMVYPADRLQLLAVFQGLYVARELSPRALFACNLMILA